MIRLRIFNYDQLFDVIYYLNNNYDTNTDILRYKDKPKSFYKSFYIELKKYGKFFEYCTKDCRKTCSYGDQKSKCKYYTTKIYDYFEGWETLLEADKFDLL